MIQRVGHIGHRTGNVEELASLYTDLFGLRPSIDLTAEKAGQRSIFIPVGNIYIELWQPVGDSPAAKSLQAQLQARGEGLSHISFVVDDVGATVKSLQVSGAQVWEAPITPSLPAAFVHPRSTKGVLVELATEGLLPELFKLGKPLP